MFTLAQHPGRAQSWGPHDPKNPLTLQTDTHAARSCSAPRGPTAECPRDREAHRGAGGAGAAGPPQALTPWLMHACLRPAPRPPPDVFSTDSRYL